MTYTPSNDPPLTINLGANAPMLIPNSADGNDIRYRITNGGVGLVYVAQTNTVDTTLSVASIPSDKSQDLILDGPVYVWSVAGGVALVQPFITNSANSGLFSGPSGQPPARNAFRFNQKVIAFDGLKLPKNISAGTTTVGAGNVPIATAGLTSFIRMRAQNTCTNIQFVFPGFGRSDFVNDKVEQIVEQGWPFNYNVWAMLEVTTYVGIIGAGSSTTAVIDSTATNWIKDQYKAEPTPITMTAASGAVAQGASTIPITIGLSKFLRKDSVMLMGTRWIRLSADHAIGATSLTVYPTAATLSGGETTNAAYFGLGAIVVATITDPNNTGFGRFAPVLSNSATVLTLGSGWNVATTGLPYEIRTYYPLTFGGSLMMTGGLGDQMNDPLTIVSAIDTDAILHTYIQGGPWPIVDGFESASDSCALGDQCYAGFSNSGSGTEGPYMPYMAIGDPVGPTPRKSWVHLADSKAATGDLVKGGNQGYGFPTSTPTRGFFSRSSYGRRAYSRLNTPGEALVAAGGRPARRRARIAALALADGVVIGPFVGNDALDTTNGVPTIAQLQAAQTALYNDAISKNVPTVLMVTCGPVQSTGSGSFSSLIPGGEGSQVPQSLSIVQAYDDWIVNTCSKWPNVVVFDVRPTVQAPGQPGIFKTFASVFTGTVDNATGNISTTVLPCAAIPSSTSTDLGANLGAQAAWGGFIVELIQSGIKYYQYIKYDTPHTVSQITMNAAFSGVTPAIGNIFNVYPASSLDWTHWSPYMNVLLQQAFDAQFPNL